MANNLKTILLLATLGTVLVLVGGAAGGRSGIIIAFLFALLINGLAYFFSDQVALAWAGAKPLAPDIQPGLYKEVVKLSEKAGIPVPKLYITGQQQANAFATGRDPKHASLAVTTGLLQLLPAEEIRAVLAHEISHIKNRDILLTSIAAVFASSITSLVHMGWYTGGELSDEGQDAGGNVSIFLLLLAPIAATILQLAVSRQREYDADRIGAQLVGSGRPLARALLDIERTTQVQPLTSGSPAFASLYTANPFGEAMGRLGNLFSTHPTTTDRVRRLVSMKPMRERNSQTVRITGI